jgi:hypothetical protein
MRITTNDINKSVGEMSIDGKREPNVWITTIILVYLEIY